MHTPTPATTTDGLPAGVDPDEGGEIIPDTEEPWLPHLRRPAVTVPTALAAAGAAFLAWSANADALGPVLSLSLAGFSAVLVFLAVIDALTQRLPDAIVLPLYIVLPLAVIAAGITGEIGWDRVLLAFACLAGAFLTYYLIIFATGGLGNGDMKLAGLLGLMLGVFGAFPVVLGTILLPIAVGGVAAGALLVAGRGPKTAIAFGPYMCAGGLGIILLPGFLVSLVSGNMFP